MDKILKAEILSTLHGGPKQDIWHRLVKIVMLSALAILLFVFVHPFVGAVAMCILGCIAGEYDAAIRVRRVIEEYELQKSEFDARITGIDPIAE